MDAGTPTNLTSHTSPRYRTFPSVTQHRPIRLRPRGDSRPPWIKLTCRRCRQPGVRRKPGPGRPRRTASPTARHLCDQKRPSASHPRDHRFPRDCRLGQRGRRPWSQCRNPLLRCPGGCLRALRASSLRSRHGQRCLMPTFSNMSRMTLRHLSLWRQGRRPRR